MEIGSFHYLRGMRKSEQRGKARLRGDIVYV